MLCKKTVIIINFAYIVEIWGTEWDHEFDKRCLVTNQTCGLSHSSFKWSVYIAVYTGNQSSGI